MNRMQGASRARFVPTSELQQCKQVACKDYRVIVHSETVAWHVPLTGSDSQIQTVSAEYDHDLCESMSFK